MNECGTDIHKVKGVKAANDHSLFWCCVFSVLSLGIEGGAPIRAGSLSSGISLSNVVCTCCIVLLLHGFVLCGGNCDQTCSRTKQTKHGSISEASLKAEITNLQAGAKSRLWLAACNKLAIYDAVPSV